MNELVRAWALLLMVWPSAASAATAPVPITIDPVRVRCFDADKLASGIRARLDDVEVSVGRAPRRSHIEVRAEQSGRSLTVHVLILDAAGRIAGKDMRRIPDQGDCPAVLEAATMIVVRAATPMTAGHLALPKAAPTPPTGASPGAVSDRSDAGPASPMSQPRSPEPAPATRTNLPSPPPAITPKPRPPEPQVAPLPPPERNAERPAAPPAPPRVALRSEAPPQPPPQAVVAASPVSSGRKQVEFEFGGGFLVGVDESISVPAGEVAIGLSGRRLGVGVRAGVSDQWTAGMRSSVGMVAIDVQRIPIAAELHLDFPFDRDAVRLAAGAGVILERADSEGLPKTAVATVAEPDVFVRASYRLGIHGWFLSFGVAVDVAFVHDDLAIDGVGVLVRTPALQIVPFANLGFRL